MEASSLRSVRGTGRKRTAGVAATVEAMVTAPTDVAASLTTGERMKPGDLQAHCLRGAKAGIQHLADLLEKGLASGVLKPRDLAVVTGILTDKAIKLEPLVREQFGEGNKTGAADLDEQADEIVRLRAELNRRGHFEEP